MKIIGEKKAPKKPESVDIKDFKPVLIPTKIPGQMATTIVGLGTDNKLYNWDQSEAEWLLNTNVRS